MKCTKAAMVICLQQMPVLLLSPAFIDTSSQFALKLAEL
ncbi:hypothetical protein C3B55_00571 [Candidatus Pseudomonas adelgestsugas]|uniref:Uncharacterized protein n=1 Tax=Candidatus Pseudomonas adelgestsugas TaxID=1302376 RepID=A0ABX5R8R6_9PSED|nr:hypothetical protein C3B55_00571 [Candidatus Pseudomonas adelgestsugas]